MYIYKNTSRSKHFRGEGAERSSLDPYRKQEPGGMLGPVEIIHGRSDAYYISAFVYGGGGVVLK